MPCYLYLEGGLNLVKKNRIICIISSLITLMLLSILFINGHDKYRRTESIDLGEENINGISLMGKYSEDSIEKILGKVLNKVEDKNYTIYEYGTQQFMGSLKVDKENNIISIAIGLGDNSFKTNREITKGSTFSDVQQAYSNNFFKKKYTNFMGSGDGYFITYIDKNNECQIMFEFNKQSNEETLMNIILSKY